MKLRRSNLFRHPSRRGGRVTNGWEYGDTVGVLLYTRCDDKLNRRDEDVKYDKTASKKYD